VCFLFVTCFRQAESLVGLDEKDRHVRGLTKLSTGLEKQHDVVRAALDDMLQVTMPIKRCLCFVEATWPLIGAKPFVINDVTVTWPAKLVEQILEPGPVTPPVIDAIAQHISQRLRSAG
jgi:hypothetical protein